MDVARHGSGPAQNSGRNGRTNKFTGTGSRETGDSQSDTGSGHPYHGPCIPRESDPVSHSSPPPTGTTPSYERFGHTHTQKQVRRRPHMPLHPGLCVSVCAYGWSGVQVGTLPVVYDHYTRGLSSENPTDSSPVSSLPRTNNPEVVPSPPVSHTRETSYTSTDPLTGRVLEYRPGHSEGRAGPGVVQGRQKTH